MYGILSWLLNRLIHNTTWKGPLWPVSTWPTSKAWKLGISTWSLLNAFPQVSTLLAHPHLPPALFPSLLPNLYWSQSRTYTLPSSECSHLLHLPTILRLLLTSLSLQPWSPLKFPILQQLCPYTHTHSPQTNMFKANPPPPQTFLLPSSAFSFEAPHAYTHVVKPKAGDPAWPSPKHLPLLWPRTIPYNSPAQIFTVAHQTTEVPTCWKVPCLSLKSTLHSADTG